jgi:hypothetical protein
MEELRQFRAFEEEAEADALQQVLEEAGIPVNRAQVNNYLDSVIAGQLNSPHQYIIELRPQDFQKAEELFDQMAQKDVESIPEDYHLYEFTNEELMEIVDQPDDWSKLDYHLAISILKKRGKEVSKAYVDQKKEESLEAQRAPQQVSMSALISGYIIILVGLSSVYMELPLGLIFMAWPIVLGIFLNTSKKTLKDGSRYFFYDERSRKHGIWLFIAGSIALFGPVVYLILFET